MAIERYYKILTPNTPTAVVQDNGLTNGYGYTNTTWYHNLVSGSAQRINRYNEYDVMDTDVDVSRALDIVAEEITGNTPKGNMPLELKIAEGIENRITSTQLVTLKAALKTWCKIQDWDNRLFSTARNLVKYGDTFFIRPRKVGMKYRYVHPRNVTGAVVNESDITDIKKWEIQNDIKSASGAVMSTDYGNLLGYADNGAMAGTVQINFDDVVWFTLYNDMSEEAPFGVSILKSVYTTFKQKELLEGAIIIYRIQRAPERRVFYLDVGKTPPHLIPSHLEQLKNEIRQKKIPSSNGGQSSVTSVFNPQSMGEDFFFATNGTTGGNRVETLPGGQNLGELQDLDYFYKKLWRGLRIPESYMNNSAEGSSPASDGKVGIAYQQEIKFTLYIERLQKALEKTLDEEFKRFLHSMKLKLDNTSFEVVLPTPSSYKESREQSINADLLNNLTAATGVESISMRMALKKYGGWSAEEILLNERLKREELGLPADGGLKDLAVIYNPDRAEHEGFDGGMGGGNLGGMDAGMGGEDPFLDDTAEQSTDEPIDENQPVDATLDK